MDRKFTVKYIYGLKIVDSDPLFTKMLKAAGKATKEDKAAKKAESKTKKLNALATAKTRKTVRKTQNKSRAAMHAAR